MQTRAFKNDITRKEGGVIMDGYNADGTKNTTAVPAEEWYSSVRNIGDMFWCKGDYVQMAYAVGRV